MALKLNLPSTQFGVPAPEAYARITNIFGTKDQFQVQVAVYFSQDARDANKSTVAEFAYYINTEDLKGDIIPAIYNVLKTFADFQGAEDC